MSHKAAERKRKGRTPLITHREGGREPKKNPKPPKQLYSHSNLDSAGPLPVPHPPKKTERPRSPGPPHTMGPPNGTRGAVGEGLGVPGRPGWVGWWRRGCHAGWGSPRVSSVGLRGG